MHVVLHGCRQNADAIGRQLVDRAGFNAWADTNRVIVLYPQTAARWFWLPPWQPYNPLACWDWWGYVSGDDSYVTKSGRQIKVIKAMLDALTAGYRPAIPAATPGNAPDALAVIDTSDTAAVLAWMPVSGATLYRISRAGADGTGWQHRGVEFCRYRTGAANVLSLARDSHHKWIGRSSCG